MVDSLPFVVAIPARYGAQRLPGKPLRLIGHRPLICHVVDCAQAAGAQAVWVATDDQRVADAVHAMPGVQVAMTAAGHTCGTDRLAECARLAQWPAQTCIVNLQGDEPFVPPEHIQAVAAALSDSGHPLATIATPLQSVDELFDPNVVKVVLNHASEALYFSRAPVPWDRASFADVTPTLPQGPWLRHVGIYAMTMAFLQQFARLPTSPLERIESLEQLRALEAGHRIAVTVTEQRFPPGIDTMDDLQRAQALWAQR